MHRVGEKNKQGGTEKPTSGEDAEKYECIHEGYPEKIVILWPPDSNIISLVCGMDR